MVIYYHTVDNGDGSSSVAFFDCQEAAKLSLELDEERDGYTVADGYYSFEAENVSGLRILSLDHLLRAGNRGPYELASCPYCDEQAHWYSWMKFWTCSDSCKKSVGHNFTDEDVL